MAETVRSIDESSPKHRHQHMRGKNALDIVTLTLKG